MNPAPTSITATRSSVTPFFFIQFPIYITCVLFIRFPERPDCRSGPSGKWRSTPLHSFSNPPPEGSGKTGALWQIRGETNSRLSYFEMFEVTFIQYYLLVRTATGYKNYTCTDDKDCTDSVEDSSTHTTGGRKGRTSHIDNVSGLLQR